MTILPYPDDLRVLRRATWREARQELDKADTSESSSARLEVLLDLLEYLDWHIRHAAGIPPDPPRHLPDALIPRNDDTWTYTRNRVYLTKPPASSAGPDTRDPLIRSFLPSVHERQDRPDPAFMLERELAAGLCRGCGLAVPPVDYAGLCRYCAELSAMQARQPPAPAWLVPGWVLVLWLVMLACWLWTILR